MKKAFMVLGGVSAVAILCAVIGVAIVILRGSALDKEAQAYVDRTVPLICADLRLDTLSQHASQQLLASASKEEFDNVFTWFRKLGEFKQYRGSSGQVHTSYTTQNGKVITGKYVAKVEFQTGPAQAEVSTVKNGDQWQIKGFRLTSPALIE